MNSLPTSQSVDVLVVGGGINGVGIARDCAQRGLSVLLAEKDDLGQGTTGGCSGMIHGGVKYMLKDVEVTRKSCIDSGYIQQSMPHLLFRIPVIFPVPKKMGGRIALELVETFFEAYDRFSHLKNGKPHTRLTPEEVREVEPLIKTRSISGAITLDEWGLDPYRACASIAMAAQQAGAEIRNHCEVVEFLFRDPSEGPDRVRGALLRDAFTGEERSIETQIVVNATGPWSPIVAKMAGSKTRIRPSKGVHLVFDRRITNAGILFNAIDGRSIFIIPYQHYSILGTTDDDFFGDPDRIEITHDEVEYLLASAEKLFPDIRKYRVIRSFAALRPTLYSFGKNENDLSRDHRIYDHGALGEAEGFISIIGGKYAAFRVMSEELTDLISKKLSKGSRCTTHSTPVPSGEAVPNAEALAEEFDFDPWIVSRMIKRHGSRARLILEMMKERPESARPICLCEGIVDAEVRYVIEHEWARTACDVLRRTRCGFGGCQGMRCATALESAVARYAPASPNQRDGLFEFLEYGHGERIPILKDDQLRQEEMARNLLLGSANLAAYLE